MNLNFDKLSINDKATAFSPIVNRLRSKKGSERTQEFQLIPKNKTRKQRAPLGEYLVHTNTF